MSHRGYLFVIQRFCLRQIITSQQEREKHSALVIPTVIWSVNSHFLHFLQSTGALRWVSLDPFLKPRTREYSKIV